jgi:hypothetical protein
MFNPVPGQQSQSYAYEPLASERSIRTVEVRGSDKPDAELCCTLKEQDLGDGPSYEAISYAWEGQTPSHRISCDGLDLLVTGNCAEILRHFRPKSPEQSRTPLFYFGDFTSLKVSDPKDKIFAVQGLLSALGVTLPDADYSKPLSTIYIDAYRALIAHQGQIGCLDELNRCWLVQETQGLPSWVPQVFGNHTPNTPTPMPLKECREPMFHFSEDGFRLHVSGF